MDNKDSLLGVLRTLFKWKRHIIYATAAAAVGSIIIALLLPVYYQSTTVFYAASPDQVKPEVLFGKGNFESEYYGNKDDVDRILTIASSNDLVEFLIDSFDLYDHYNINRDHPRAPYNIKLAFFKRYEIVKTKREALELSIEDKDKARAAEMARAARERISYIAMRLVRETQGQAIRTFEDDIVNKEQILRLVSDTLIGLRQKYGIYNSSAQTETLTAQYSEAESRLINGQARLEALQTNPRISRDTVAMLAAKVKGSEREVSGLAEKLALLNEGISQVSTFERQYQEANQSLSEDKERLKQYHAVYKSDAPAIILVEEAQVPVIKSRPQRSLIVVAATGIVFLFSLIGVLLFDNYRDVNWRQIYHGE